MKKLVVVLVVLIFAVCVGALKTVARAESTAATQDTASEAADKSEWWNILLLGGDSRNKSAYERTDSIIILSINKAESKAKMTSIMRDTWVSYPGMPGHGKINAANVYGGPELTVKTVNESFGTDIEDFVLINMVGLVDVIDQIGGIDIPATEGEKKWVNAAAKGYLETFGPYDGELSIGKSGDSVHLNGLLAMTFCRNRTIGTDYTRVQRQRIVLLAVLEKMKSLDAAQLAAVVTSAFGEVETNLNLIDVISLANVGLNLDEASIEQNRIPADGTFESGMKDGFWSIRPDFEKNKELLSEFIYGEKG